jgi:hypothetical protein
MRWLASLIYSSFTSKKILLRNKEEPVGQQRLNAAKKIDPGEALSQT